MKVHECINTTGPEKLIEIWFEPTSGLEAHSCLRSVERRVWEEMLDVVKCQVLSVIENHHADAYLLSESSMFVYPKKLVLKTCGTTTLLHSVPHILKIAADIGLGTVDAFFYSRKSFLFPEQQEWPHGQWNVEVDYLDKIFPANHFETAGYVFGKINGDHWNLYTCMSDSHDLNINHDHLDCNSDQIFSPHVEDVTLEILMTDLDQDSMQHFWRTQKEKELAEKEAILKGKNIRKNTFNDKRIYVILFYKFFRLKLALLISTPIQRLTITFSTHVAIRLTDYWMNTIIQFMLLLKSIAATHRLKRYNTCANFKTVPVKQFSREKSGIDHNRFVDVIDKVVNIFKPGKVSTTVFIRSSEIFPPLLNGKVKGYRKRDAIVQNLGRWQIYFNHYDKKKNVKE